MFRVSERVGCRDCPAYVPATASCCPRFGAPGPAADARRALGTPLHIRRATARRRAAAREDAVHLTASVIGLLLLAVWCGALPAAWVDLGTKVAQGAVEGLL